MPKLFTDTQVLTKIWGPCNQRSVPVPWHQIVYQSTRQQWPPYQTKPYHTIPSKTHLGGSLSMLKGCWLCGLNGWWWCWHSVEVGLCGCSVMWTKGIGAKHNFWQLIENIKFYLPQCLCVLGSVPLLWLINFIYLQLKTTEKFFLIHTSAHNENLMKFMEKQSST